MRATPQFLKRIFTVGGVTFLLVIIGTLAAVLSIPWLQPLISGGAAPDVNSSVREPIAPPQKAQPAAAEKWMYVGRGGAGVERGLHADFVLVSSIRNIGRGSFRLRLANVYSKPQYHNTTMAKVIAVVDCTAMTITYEELSAYYRNGGHDGTVSVDVEDAKTEPVNPGNFNHNAARYVCNGPLPSDRQVAEEDLYTML